MTTDTAALLAAQRLLRAADVYLDREAGRCPPHGSWSAWGVWAPDQGECDECCTPFARSIDTNPRAWFDHCFSLEHVATRYGVAPGALDEAVSFILTLVKEPF